MWWFITYAVIGLFLAIIIILDDGRRAITQPLYTVLIIFLWPVFVVYFTWALSQVGVITHKGKVIWKAKRK